MANDEKRGRVTPKESLRYTPPKNDGKGPSPTVVPVMMGVFFFIGVMVIILNYFPGAPLLPGDTSNTNLLIGLGSITVGFVLATQWR